MRSVYEHSVQTGLSTEQVLDQLVTDARNAIPSNEEEVPLEDLEGVTTSSSGESDEGYPVVLGCSVAGNFTYSFARHLGVNHGHNVIFTESCAGVHAAGLGKKVERVTSEHRLWHKKQYPAHVRAVKKASTAQKKKSAAFAKKQLGKEYNANFAFNKTVNATHYNCSQLVWAAWKNQGYDLDSNGGTGVYPEDLWKSPSTEGTRFLVKARR